MGQRRIVVKALILSNNIDRAVQVDFQLTLEHYPKLFSHMTVEAVGTTTRLYGVVKNGCIRLFLVFMTRD